ncbi:MAG: helix-turn-helix domain-containing protein [bacterium]
MLEDLLTTRQLADYLKVHEMTIYKLLQSQEIPAIKVGRKWRFRKTTIKLWIEEREAESVKRWTPQTTKPKRWNAQIEMIEVEEREKELYDIFKVEI